MNTTLLGVLTLDLKQRTIVDDEANPLIRRKENFRETLPEFVIMTQ